MIRDSDIQAYERDGVVMVRSVIDPETAKRMHDASRALMDQTHAYPQGSTRSTRVGDQTSVKDDPGRVFGGAFMSDSLPVFRDFVMNSALPEAAGRLMRSSVARFFYDQLFVKEPGTVSPTLWHNDMPFWPLTGSHLISGWVALTPVTRESSGLEYVAGSHRWDKHYQATADYLKEAHLEPAPDFSDPANRDGHRFLSWDMQPGDVLFHHPLAVHGAGGNKSKVQGRIGLSVRYVGDDAQWAPREKAMKLPRDPKVAPGEYPADDDAFPVAWRRALAPAA